MTALPPCCQTAANAGDVAALDHAAVCEAEEPQTSLFDLASPKPQEGRPQL
jgi:hypothetical protein